MHPCLRYSLKVLLLVLALQALAIFLLSRFAAPAIVNTNDSRVGIFQTDSKMAVYASPLVARGAGRPQVVVLGSSNTTMGIRPEHLMPLLGDTPVHNLSIGSEKMRGIPQMVDLLFRQTPPDERRNYVFVFGISYPLISDEPRERANPNTTVDDELQRFGLFAKTSTGSQARVSDDYLSAGLLASWPYLVPKAVYNHLIRIVPEVYWFGLAEPVPFTPEQSNTVVYSKQQNQDRIDFYNAQILDETGEYSFDYVLRAAKMASDAGAQVVVIDLPTAKWLQQSTHHYAAYRKLRAGYITQLEKLPGVRYLNIETGFDDADFYDGVHPRYRITPTIAARIAPTIARALKENTP
jgi:hypothetical protein